MAALGWTHRPAERVFLPEGVVITTRVDQPNVITAIGDASMADAVLKTLTDTLPRYGWTITASGGGSLVFSDAHDAGAFTSDPAVWALTVRVTG